MKTKRCPKCGIVKEVTEFHRNKRQAGGFQSYCKKCFLANQKKYRQTEKAKKVMRETDRKRRNSPTGKSKILMRKYGISLEQWQGLFDKQEGCCAICGTHQSELKQTLNVDHCHVTEIVRGLLCINCNMAIGLLQDNSNTAKKASEYLSDNCC